MDKCHKGDHQAIEANHKVIDELQKLNATLEAENERLKRIINMAGGSPPPGILQFTDILLPLEAENKAMRGRIKLALLEMGHIEGEKTPTENRVEQALTS